MRDLNFDNSYARLPEHWFQRRAPTPLKRTHLISFNAPLAAQLGLNPCDWTPAKLVKTFGGLELPEGSEPLAMKYTGHQFGQYNPELGDGRGVLLGEHLAPDGQRWDLHLKGAGQTAYSRFGDGKAVLRSSIREYLVSEAMQGLGIPTTRALCLLGSDQLTQRNGMEPCALLVRATPCHIRFGHFEYFYYSGQHEDLKRLADYVIQRFYPELQGEPDPYLALFTEVLRRSAKLVALWQAYGFVHGVMNTDNMSIIGETFDFGPYTFMDHYEPGHIANKNDHQGRYRFSNQPSIMQWNMAALAQALLPLIAKDALEAVLETFAEHYYDAYYKRLSERLGLATDQLEDRALIDRVLELLEQGRGDLNRFLLWLNQLEAVPSQLDESAGTAPEMAQWISDLLSRRAQAGPASSEAKLRSRQVNPTYVLRNYMAQEAISDAEGGDYQRVNDLLALLRNPFNPYPGLADYAGTPPEWAESIHLTCSS